MLDYAHTRLIPFEVRKNECKITKIFNAKNSKYFPVIFSVVLISRKKRPKKAINFCIGKIQAKKPIKKPASNWEKRFRFGVMASWKIKSRTNEIWKLIGQLCPMII